MLDSALGRLSLSSTSCRRRSVACAATLPARVRDARRQLSESHADSGECGGKAPSAAHISIPSESASLSSSPSAGTSCCPSAMLDSALSSASCRRRSVFELLSERDAGHNSMSSVELLTRRDAGLSSRLSVAELDFLSSSLSVQVVVRARCWT